MLFEWAVRLRGITGFAEYRHSGDTLLTFALGASHGILGSALTFFKVIIFSFALKRVVFTKLTEP
jgi:hypothetical protein